MKLTRSPPANALGALPRRALFQTFAAALVSRSLPALGASYTVVSSGSIAEKESRLAEVKKLFEQRPEDPYVFGEKAQLEFDIAALQRNQKYVSQLASRVNAGEQKFSTRLTVPVPNMESAVGFWTGGCGALVLDTRLVNGKNVTRVGFGPESLRKDDGAKFSMELVESSEPSRLGADNAVVQYLQLAMPVFRLSKVMAAGGEIESAYGWTQLVAPGGIPLRVRIDETRRDPFEFVAVRTNDLAKTTKHYEEQGMRLLEKKERKKFKLSIDSNSLFEDADAFEPEREMGAVLLGWDDAAMATGLLLLPPTSRTRLEPVPSAIQLGVVGSSPAAEVSSPDGLRSVFFSSPAFEAALAA